MKKESHAPMTDHQQTPNLSVESEDQEEVIELRPQREHQLMRLDRYVASELPDLSRTYLQQLITEGRLLADGQSRRAAFKMTPGQVVSITLPITEEFELEAQDIPLDVIFEDDDILVINKPAGMVVHPAPGHPRDTLVNAVLFHAPNISIQGSTRPGVVHRLDKDTSGVMVIAKSNRAQSSLIDQWQERGVTKHYTALVAGVVEEDSATIDAPIARNTVNRQQMRTISSGREAITHFTVIERFANATLLDVRIETGRTHQIRVHLAFIGHPVVGDGLYGNKVSARVAEELGLKRQFLHAASLTFAMPSSGDGRTFDAPLAPDLQTVLDILRTPLVEEVADE
jgi:23S rRNA pseudouridine1911/1915/1917 synthase